MGKQINNPYGRIERYISSLPKELLIGHRLPAKEYSDDVIPFEVYRGIPSYIRRIANQINKSFHFEIYDGCLVLMRRLTETLLILTYVKFGVGSVIKDEAGNYFRLSNIINNALSNSTLSLTSNSKKSLKHFAIGGNLSAHNLYFTARKKDISPELRLQFRAMVEELLNKGGLLK